MAQRLCLIDLQFCANLDALLICLLLVCVPPVRFVEPERLPGNIWEFTQEAGEVVYVPPNWGHAILNLEPSVGVSLQVGRRRAVEPAAAIKELWERSKVLHQPPAGSVLPDTPPLTGSLT